MKKHTLYVDLLMQEWGMHRCSNSMQRSMRELLNCYPAEIQLFLRNHPKLQVEVCRWLPETVWAYFPIRGDGVNPQLPFLVDRNGLRLKDDAEVLLLLESRLRRGETTEERFSQLLHHFGHVLLYLRKPKARNECANARRENALICGWNAKRAYPGC